MKTEGHAAVTWLRTEEGPGGAVFRSGVRAGRLVAEWEGIGTLEVDADGSNPTTTVRPHVPPDVAARWLGGPVRALVRHASGKITLHGSAFAIDGVTIVCIGASGAGKSTTATAACRRLGAELLADDTVFLEDEGERVRVEPSQEVLWLRSDAARAFGVAEADDLSTHVKTPWAPGNRSRSTREVHVVVDLVFHGDAVVRVAPLRGARAFRALSLSTFTFARPDASPEVRSLENLARLASRVELVSLGRPDDLARIDDTCDALAALASGIRGRLEGGGV
ncbi:MAG: hypothetical protein U0169_13680 [Polyangiaceae bacterium]